MESSSDGEKVNNTESGRFPSPERKKVKKSQSSLNGSGSSSNITSPISSPNAFSVPPLVSPSAGLSNFSRMKFIADEKLNKSNWLLSKRREFTIAPPEPPQPLENPRDD